MVCPLLVDGNSIANGNSEGIHRKSKCDQKKSDVVHGYQYIRISGSRYQDIRTSGHKGKNIRFKLQFGVTPPYLPLS